MFYLLDNAKNMNLCLLDILKHMHLKYKLF